MFSAEVSVDLLLMQPVIEYSLKEQRQFLAKHNITFLYPLVLAKEKVGDLLASQITVQNANDAALGRAFLKLLKENLTDDVLEHPLFVKVLFQTLCEYVTTLTSSSGGPGHIATKEEITVEQKLFVKMLPVVAKFVGERKDSQVDLIYALQTFCHANKFPKGLLLRISVYLYDESVVEEAAWMKWREDLREGEPGKGEALVALNEYLNWMEEGMYVTTTTPPYYVVLFSQLL